MKHTIATDIFEILSFISKTKIANLISKAWFSCIEYNNKNLLCFLNFVTKNSDTDNKVDVID